jgi:hypothetical protein
MIKMFKWIMKKTKKNNAGKPPVFPKTEACEILTVTRTEEFIPHFVYSNKRNEIIDSIYLTESQAFKLNKLMRSNGVDNMDIVFLRK